MIRQALTLLATALLLGVALAALLVWFIAPRAHAQTPPYTVHPVLHGCLFIAGNPNSTAMVFVPNPIGRSCSSNQGGK